MKKLIPILLVLVLVLACCLVACNKKSETVKATPALEQGFYSPKAYYGVGDSFDAAGATVKYYANVADSSTLEEVNVAASMVSGFDTTTAGTNKTMTVTYKGLSINFPYSVYAYTQPDTTLAAGSKFVTFVSSESKLLEYSFTTADKSVSVKTYANYVDFKNNNAASSAQATYSYTIISDGSTALKFSLSNTPYVVKVVNANSIEVNDNTSLTGISKYDASEVVEPQFEGYISQNENTTTHKFKTMLISEKKEGYADKYCIATVDSNYTLKIYELDEAKTADQLSTETPAYTIAGSNLFYYRGSLNWLLRENGRMIASASVRKDTANNVYLNITKQSNSAQEIMGYTVQCYLYTLIDTDYAPISAD